MAMKINVSFQQTIKNKKHKKKNGATIKTMNKSSKKEEKKKKRILSKLDYSRLKWQRTSFVEIESYN